MTLKMQELQWQVVTWAHCPWVTFCENVLNEGWTMKRLSQEADRCDDEKSYRNLINRFV